MEKIIYAVAALTIDTPTQKGIVQVPGRMSAQFGHAVSRMKMYRMARVAMNSSVRGLTDKLYKMADEAITTIHLECRDSKELAHVARLLRERKVKFYEFEDRNPGVYGPGEFTTALATFPVYRKQVEGILDYLPLFAKDLVKSGR